MARTVRRKSKDDLILEKENNGNNHKNKKASRTKRKNKLRQIDYTDPSVLEDLEDSYEY